MNAVAEITHRLHEQEIKLLEQFRAARRNRADKTQRDFTYSEKIADWVAATMGSWNFILIQSALLVVWIALNVTAYVQQWDPYPFILLNLAFSLQAAYAAPLILLAQTRQADRDKCNSIADAQHREELHQVNEDRQRQMQKQSGLMIEMLQQNTTLTESVQTLLRQNTELTEAVRVLVERIEAMTAEVHIQVAHSGR